MVTKKNVFGCEYIYTFATHKHWSDFEIKIIDTCMYNNSRKSIIINKCCNMVIMCIHLLLYHLQTLFFLFVSEWKFSIWIWFLCEYIVYPYHINDGYIINIPQLIIFRWGKIFLFGGVFHIFLNLIHTCIKSHNCNC